MTLFAVLLALSQAAPPPAETRTVYRCTRDGTVSLATAPEPGSRCQAITYDANAARLPDLWGVPGAQRGVLYQRQQDGRTVYSTRELPGSTRVLAFAVPAPPGSPAHAGLADPGPPRTDVYRDQFRAAARLTGVDEAWLRAIAHVESGYDPQAVSPKGAQGLMQLMPDTAAAYEVTDPFDPNQSIQAGARHLGDLMRRYPKDLRKVAAAYNAGAEAVDRHGGVPPYAETLDYVEKVMRLHGEYRRVTR
ncbi:lytic transglycosylase domain-containing protein [Arenimonas daejeonensis]|uniref:lytic transglycosylase domain-containing protein n=1 Tax=Arenimonas daejeonensis TaxID=370777 RepID=UPI0011BE4248|nr:lytic transglycosylase domain-containing protein [Arenimonas daejeonensis]